MEEIGVLAFQEVAQTGNIGEKKSSGRQYRLCKTLACRRFNYYKIDEMILVRRISLIVVQIKTPKHEESIP